MNQGRSQHDKGFTLMESLLAVVILALAVGAITMPFTAGARNEQVDARRTVAVGLAQEMMEEILAKNFEDDLPEFARNPGPDPGETDRSLFDNIDDYDGYEEQPGAIADAQGQVIDDPPTAKLSRHVTTTYVHVSGQDVSEPASFVRIVVEINYSGQLIVQLTRLVYALPDL